MAGPRYLLRPAAAPSRWKPGRVNATAAASTPPAIDSPRAGTRPRRVAFVAPTCPRTYCTTWTRHGDDIEQQEERRGKIDGKLEERHARSAASARRQTRRGSPTTRITASWSRINIRRSTSTVWCRACPRSSCHSVGWDCCTAVSLAEVAASFGDSIAPRAEV